MCGKGSCEPMRGWGLRRRFVVAAAVALFLTVVGPVARAGGPRWVTGPPYFSAANPGQPVVWYTNHPLYFTDPGDLSTMVNHAAADAMVAAAAAVWNVPTSALVLAQGGTLAEHVSGANVYPSGTGLVFPADVQTSNYLAIQIAVVYDDDGSVTDMILGADASDPSGCRQNAVTESVDSISTSGFIQHAMLVLNGRCAGAAPEQMLQMQYQLMRAFGRVLGLGWSQTNDNVFTYTPAPTYDQAMHWPVMHPIDIICGPYTYQCMPQPFRLREDDLSALAELYMIGQGQAQTGQTDTLFNASQIAGRLSFPDGQGMQGVNVLGRRLEQYWNVPETWYTVSSVSGERYRRSNGNPVTGSAPSRAGSMGESNNYYEGWYQFGRVPLIDGDWQDIIFETEPVNPLYVGEYSVGPYMENTVTPSGSDPVFLSGLYPSYADYNWIDLSTVGAASACVTGDGGSTEGAPTPVDGINGMVDRDVVRVWACRVVVVWSEGVEELYRRGDCARRGGVCYDDEGDASGRRVECDGRAGIVAGSGGGDGSVQRDGGGNDGGDGFEYRPGSVTYCDCGPARGWPSGFWVPGQGALCGLDLASGRGLCGRHGDDYGDGISRGKCGDGEWSGGDGDELECYVDCGGGAGFECAGECGCFGGGRYGDGFADGWEHGDDGSADVLGFAAECDDADVGADGDGVCRGCCGHAVCGEGDVLGWCDAGGGCGGGVLGEQRFGAVWGLRSCELYGDDECCGCGLDDGDSGGGGDDWVVGGGECGGGDGIVYGSAARADGDGGAASRVCCGGCDGGVDAADGGGG